jgi:hypothetical protein
VRKGQPRRILSPEEIARRRREVRRLAGHRQTDHEIAATLGVSWRTVLRDRQAENIPAGYDPKTRFTPRSDEFGAEYVGGVKW